MIPPSQLLRDEFVFSHTYEEPVCIDLYYIGRSAAGPESQAESIRMFEESRARPERVREIELMLVFRKVEEVTAEAGSLGSGRI